VVVKGFDTDNTKHPLEDLNTKYQPLIDELQADGWDIIVFDYVCGDIDLKQNAENLAHFIRYLDSISIPEYHLALVGGSMGVLWLVQCLFRSIPIWGLTLMSLSTHPIMACI